MKNLKGWKKVQIKGNYKMGIIQAIKDAIKKHKKYDPLDFNTEYLDKWRDAMEEDSDKEGA